MQWVKRFKSAISAHPDAVKIKTSLASLVDARNDFAHGGSPTVTLSDVIDYFNYSKHIILILDCIIV